MAGHANRPVERSEQWSEAQVRAQNQRARSRERERKQAEEADPLTHARRAYMDSVEAVYRFLGFVSDGHSDDSAMLRAGITDEDFQAALLDRDFAFHWERAKKLRRARYDDELRELALALNGKKRGQTMALRQWGDRLSRDDRTPRRRQAQEEKARSNLSEMSDEELEALAAEDD